MGIRRREFLTTSTAVLWALGHAARAADPVGPQLIVDTHQHLWVRDQIDPPWVGGAAGILRLSYGPAEYREATRGLNVRSIYMEIAAAEADLDREAETAIAWCGAKNSTMVGAIIGGRPSSDAFGDYIARHAASKSVQGVRQVLHAGTPPGTCLDPKFVAGMRVLGERGLTFDLCMRPGELLDGAKLAAQCPETRFVIDHCGNADPKAFLKGDVAGKPSHSADDWKRAMERLAALPNTVCKISGLVARAPLVWDAEVLAPVINHCLEVFGPDRVIFGSDWPVCLTRATLQQWVAALREIISSRPAADQEKLWSGNALRMYKLSIT
ncbi:Amidohydrolase [Caulifigura coniformis]|uniref:Amidohydrolase n=1 Tax=Caulifigura coniformis TaxID=2527983 RepID=A0A517SGS5_9PLAN|nr:amidohydrolase family protein [Caulifigura coniformis]QDT55329.1 Amidohydrolase [Caulifigura coniformis]